MGTGTTNFIAMINDFGGGDLPDESLTVVTFDRWRNRSGVALSPTTTCWVAPAASRPGFAAR